MDQILLIAFVLVNIFSLNSLAQNSNLKCQKVFFYLEEHRVHDIVNFFGSSPKTGAFGVPFVKTFCGKNILTDSLTAPVIDGEPKLIANPLPQAKFLNKLEAAKILRTQDEFIVSLNQFNVKIRLKDEPQSFADFLSAQSLEWSVDEVSSIQKDFNQLLMALDSLNFQINYPSKILFIKTTGKEEFGAPHTRQNAIILPQGKSS